MGNTRRSSKSSETTPRKRAPARSPEEREQHVIGEAMDLAERQIREGTASAQVITHFLKLGTARERLELAKLEREDKLLEARVNQLASAQRMEELYESAILAMRGYAGIDDPYELEPGDDY